MLQRLFAIAACVALLLCVGSAVLWLRDPFWPRDRITLRGGGSGSPHVSYHFAGFSFERWEFYQGPGWVASAPIWVIPATAILPAWWLLHRFGRKSLTPERPGCCTRCGYDLRATPDRCPECGTEINGPAT